MDALLDDLDADQRAAVTAELLPLAILAPAGSGKTRVLTRRIAYRVRGGLCDAKHVLALTFTRKAAGELVDRLDRLGAHGPVTAGTFHAIALRELRGRAVERGREPPQVLDAKFRFLRSMLGEQRRPPPMSAGELAIEIEWAKARLVAPDRYAGAARVAGRKLSLPPDDVADLYAQYERERRRRHLLDFDDLLRQCADSMANDPDFGAAQHWRFRHFYVDEFQDATPLQLAVLRAWLHGRDDLCVVGDPAQAIYAFAGADASPLRDFEQTFPGGSTIALTRNYRSAEPVVAIAEVALGSAGGARAVPKAIRGVGDAPALVEYQSDLDEATAIAGACRRAFTRGVPFHDMAILFRTNAQSAAFATALTKRGVPFHVTDGERFASRAAVRPVLDGLRTKERESSLSFPELLAELAADDTMTADEVRDERDRVLELGREYVAEVGAGSVAGFASWLDINARADALPEAGVALVTFHRAKGLEWPLVFVTGVERGLVPIAWATTAEARAEERRLLHVALSRAEDELHLSWSRSRVFGSRRVNREPTPWIVELTAAAQAYEEVARDHYAHLAEMRTALSASDPVLPRPPRRLRR